MYFQSGITNYQFYGNESATMFDSCTQNLGWFDKVYEASSPPQFQRLVADDDDSGGKVEPPSAEVVVPDCGNNNKKVVEKKEEKTLEAKAIANLKSHSEAERRRRQRINSHLDTLRGLLPSTQKKLDKATLLADVIRQVKDLKKKATNATEGLVVPMDADAVKVEPQEEDDDGTYRFKASICCDYKPKLLSDLRQALAGLKLKTTHAEISTFKGRALNVFILSTQTKQGTTTNTDDKEARRVYASSIQDALNTVLDKAVIELDYSPRTKFFQEKKQKISFLDSSSSSL